MPLLILFLIILSPIPGFSQTLIDSSDQVWKVGDHRWTLEEEYRFGKWVDETVTEDFFIRYKIPTDCADAVYAIRWIYARMNSLPAAATTRDGRLIGHWSSDWKHLPTHPEWHRDERFRAALFYLLRKTWTGTLSLDTYPVRISPDSVTPGTLFLVTESHTGIIGHVFLDGSQAHPLQTWESQLPIKVQKLSLRYFFSGRPELNARSGLVKFKWLVSENGEWKYLPDKEHPFYSEEQYQPAFTKDSSDFVEAVAKRIDPKTYDPKEKMNKVIGTITRFLRERVSIVLAGYQECYRGKCQEGSEQWEIHSTSGRDGMIMLIMDHLSEIIALNHLDKENTERMMKAISIDISGKRSITFYDVYQNYLWLSSHPGDSIDARWGLKKCEMIHAQTRATYDSIDFIDKTYRKKDSQYADFSIRQQEYILQRLNEEWVRSKCIELPSSPVKKASLSFSPEGTVEGRGRLKKCERIRIEIHATQDSLTFIEKTYRKKDPDYADFSIQQQERILEKLNEEWKKFGCKGLAPASEKKGDQ